MRKIKEWLIRIFREDGEKFKFIVDDKDKNMDLRGFTGKKMSTIVKTPYSYNDESDSDSREDI
jgi:hypothetical protein